MGVAGSGKTVIGAAFAAALPAHFLDGDDFHTPENVARMASGTPLTDADRASWLNLLSDKLRTAVAANEPTVLACSALKRRYRDTLRQGAPDLQLIFLTGARALIGQRLTHRRGHFMPPSLLDSQLAALEEPAPDEHPWVIDVSPPIHVIVADLLRRARA